jgi:hypothetical protein
MPAERMMKLMDEAGIDRAIVSPANVAPKRSPVCGQAAAAKYPKRFRVMAWFVPTVPEQYQLLPRWLDQPGVCSLRLSMNEPEHQKMFADGLRSGVEGMPRSGHAGGDLDACRSRADGTGAAEIPEPCLHH